MEAALGSLSWAHARHGDPPFASACRLAVRTGGPEVDLMGRFAIATAGGICLAYHLMERREKAALLCGYLRLHGARAEIVGRLLVEPLPAHVRQEIRSWSPRADQTPAT